MAKTFVPFMSKMADKEKSMPDMKRSDKKSTGRKGKRCMGRSSSR